MKRRLAGCRLEEDSNLEGQRETTQGIQCAPGRANRPFNTTMGPQTTQRAAELLAATRASLAMRSKTTPTSAGTQGKEKCVHTRDDETVSDEDDDNEDDASPDIRAKATQGTPLYASTQDLFCIKLSTCGSM